MSIDTAAPRTRRAIIAGAFGALLGTIGLSAKPRRPRRRRWRRRARRDEHRGRHDRASTATAANPVFRVANADEDGIQAISANGGRPARWQR